MGNSTFEMFYEINRITNEWCMYINTLKGMEGADPSSFGNSIFDMIL